MRQPQVGLEPKDRPSRRSDGNVTAELAERVAASPAIAGRSEHHLTALRRLTTTRSGSTSSYVLRLQRQFGNSYAGRVIRRVRAASDGSDIPGGVNRAIGRIARSGDSGNHVLHDSESPAGSDVVDGQIPTDAAARSLHRARSADEFTSRQNQKLSGPSAITEAADRNVIRRFRGSVDFITRYDIDGSISSVGFPPMAITSRDTNVNLLAGTSGELTISFECRAIGRTSGFIKGGIVFVEFSLAKQKIPYRITPDGQLTVETAAISPGHTTHDSSTMGNPFGSSIGVSIGTSVDSSPSPRFVIEQIGFVVGGGGIQVGISRGPVSVGGPTIGGSGSEATSLALRFNFNVVGAQPPAPAPSPTTSATAAAAATAVSIVTGATPAPVAAPPPHPIYFVPEGQTEGDRGELVRWAQSLPAATKDAIRTGRLTTTVMGYASTTGSDRANFEHYSRRRAEWVRSILAPALGVEVSMLRVGWAGSDTAPLPDRSRQGGVPNPHERRADIIFTETAPMTPFSVTAGSSAGSSATARPGP